MKLLQNNHTIELKRLRRPFISKESLIIVVNIKSL